MDGSKRFLDMFGALSRLRELAPHEHWSHDAIGKLQRERFADLVRHAVRTTPFYARHYAGIALEDSIDPAALPTVDKVVLMDNFDDAVADRRLTLEGVRRHVSNMEGDAYLLGAYRAVGTAGTSGLRGFFVYDRSAWRTVLANTLRWNLMMGVRPRFPVRTRIASIGAEDPMHVTDRIPRSGAVGLFRVRHFEATQPFRNLADGLQAFRPDVILSYPSLAALLANEQIAGRLAIAPKVLSTHSEVLTDDMRARIGTAWGIRPFNHYGLTEEPHVAAECEAHEGMHIFEDTCLVEVVDEANRPVPDGTEGARYLLTNLYNLVQPIIRYEVSDVLTVSVTPCPCGRSFARITSIGGRAEDVLRLPAARGAGTVPVTPMSLELAMERFDAVAEYAVSHSPSRIVVTVVPRSGADPALLGSAIADALTAIMREGGAVPAPVDVVFAANLERRRERMGKLRLVSGTGGNGPEPAAEP